MKNFKLMIVFVSIIFMILSPAIFSQGKPDLKAKISCPKVAKPGEELGDKIQVLTMNAGQIIAKEIGVDLVLSSDTVIPAVTAVYKPNWVEDVLLQGGREFIKDLAAGASVNVKMNGNNKIPADTPPGIYYIGVFVDSTYKNDELSESNNTDVCRIYIRSPISGGDNAAGTPGTPTTISQGKPDLKPRITCPKYAKAGEDLGDKIKVITENIGQIIAKEIGVDLVLSSDTVIPLVTAVYKPGWGEDVLLLGGREFISELSAGASVNVKMNGNNRIPADTPSGIYYLGVFVDSTYKNDELSESNNTDVCRIVIRGQISGGDNAAGTPGTPTTISQGKPDLKAKISCPKVAKPGEELGDKIQVLTMNAGQIIAKEIGVDLVLSSDTVIPAVTAVYKPNWVEDVLLQGGREFIKDLAAGASVNVKMNGNNKIPADTPPGIYYIGVFVDSTYKNDELSESNNTDACRIYIRGQASGGDNAAGTPGTHPTAGQLPDLKMEKVYVTPDPVDKGTKTDLHCEFKNEGGDLVGTWRVSYQIDGKEVYTQNWGDIPAGGFRNPSGVWVAGEPGQHIFRCVLDPDNTIKESIESNNALKMEFAVKSETEIHRIKPGHTVPINTGVFTLTKPDLVVRISASNKAFSGDAIDVIKLTVKNVGTAIAKGTDTAGTDGYMVDIVLSRDNNLPVKFAVLGEEYKEDMLLIGGRMSRTPDLAPGKSKTWILKKIISTLPDTPSGKYCLGAVVDPGLKINESNEANNTHCTAILLAQIVK